MKKIKDFEVKYVLSPLEEKNVISGALGCSCTVYGAEAAVADKLYVDGRPVSSHIMGPGDICVEGLNRTRA